MRKLSRILAERAGSTILLLAHGGVNRVILFDALKLDLSNLTRLDQSYGCINIIDYYDDSGPVVKLVNG
jgi:broad specificity phosphatase PhoE